MPAPVFDDFNRANGDLTSPWVKRGTGGPVGGMTYEINSNTLRKKATAAGDTWAVYGGSVTSADQWALAEWASVGNQDIGPVVRTSQDGSNLATGYFYSPGGGNIGKLINGSFTALTGAITSNYTTLAGQTVGTSVNGSSIYALQDRRILQGSPITDTSITQIGDGAGIFIYDGVDVSTIAFDNFRGGDLRTNNATAPASVFTRSSTMVLTSQFVSSSTTIEAIPPALASIPAGRLVVIGGWVGNGNPTITSISDLAGNTYTLVRQDTNSGGAASRTFLAYGVLTYDLTPGDSILLNYSSGVNRSPVVLAASYEVPGPVNFVGSGYGIDETFPTSSNPTSSSVTATKANTLAVGFAFGNQALPTWTPTSGFTQNTSAEESSHTYFGYVEDGLVGAGSVASSPTMTGASYWTSYLAVFDSAAAPTTVTFDISPTSNDGGGYRKGSTWAGVPAAAYNATDGSPISLIKSLFAAEYYVGCTYFRFDTSSLPDGATVTAAALKLYVSDKGDPDNVDYAADSYDFTSQPSDASDWEYSSSGNAIATIDATSVTTGVVNSFPITTLGVISLTGFTTLRLAPKNTTTPTGDNFIEVSLSEDATPARRPQLEVTYTDPGAGTYTLAPHNVSPLRA